MSAIERAHALVPAPQRGELPRTDVIAGTRTEVANEVRRGSKRGEYATVSAMRHLDGYTWAVKVVRVKERPPAWRKWAIGAGIAMAVLGALCGAGWWLTSSLRHSVSEHGVWMALTLAAISAVAAGALKRSLLAEINVKIFK